MEIIRRSEGITAGELYTMTKGSEVRKLSDAKGETLNILYYVLYKDTNTDTGEISTVLAIRADNGGYYATNSKTFIRNFNDIQAMFEDAGEPAPTSYKVNCARSKNGREYLVCDLA